MVLLESGLCICRYRLVKNADGSYFEDFTTQSYYNPVAMMNHSQLNNKVNTLVGSFTTQVKLPFDLTYNIALSYQKKDTLQGQYLDSYFTNNFNGMYNNPDPGFGFHLPQSFGTNGQATRTSFENSNKILETYLTWDKKIGYHSINAVLGYSWQSNIFGDGFSVTTSNFPVDNISYNNLALSNPYAVSSYRINFGADGVYQQTRLISDFARLNYSYQDKYLLQGSVRKDGSSVFGTDKQWGYFPSVGAGWRISQEGFMRDQHIFSELKLRASYGVTGNATGFNAYTAQFISGSFGTYYYNGVQTAALGPIQCGSMRDLQWGEDGDHEFRPGLCHSGKAD